MENLKFSDLSRYAKPNQAVIDQLLAKAIAKSDKKIIVLDDDPTGVQTVHDVLVVTDWSTESIEKGFATKESLFFILTNSRSFTEEETTRAHQEIARNIMEVSKKLGKDFMIVSRGDSTMRGHFPLETDVLKESIEASSAAPFDGEIICPFFKEGGRYTLNNIHYVKDQDELIPSGQTEFAKDKTFGYASSHLGEWVEEKTKGRFSKESVTMITLEELRNIDVAAVSEKLCAVTGFNKVVVNAVDYCDIQVFCIGLYDALAKGKRFLYRTAAGFVKVLGGISDKPLLTSEELFGKDNHVGGIIVAGSHTKKTTEQLENLHQLPGVVHVLFNSHLVLESQEVFQAEIDRVIDECSKLLQLNHTVSLCTRRDLLVLNSKNKEDELKMSVSISEALTSIVDRLKVRPRFVIAKGGITSSDIGTKALKVKQAIVAGQIKPGIPVWICGEESKYPNLPYIIFPGNVGEPTTLKEIVEELTK